MIKVSGLTKSYAVKGKRSVILDDISFEIQTGESVALLGKNGAGKSTLIRLLGGMDHPDQGTVETDQSLSWPVGLLGGFQGSLTARENIKFVSKIYAENGDVDRIIRFVQDFAELGVHFDRPFKTYSNGMRARIKFGLSMAFRFDVYLMDEVTAAGDQAFREKAKALLKWRSEQSSFIMVSHNLWGLKLHCDRALVLHQGKITSLPSLEQGIALHKEQLGLAEPKNKRRPKSDESSEARPHPSDQPERVAAEVAKAEWSESPIQSPILPIQSLEESKP
jgi:capsular polysaccharide transport system ATP-binding protein